MFYKENNQLSDHYLYFTIDNYSNWYKFFNLYKQKNKMVDYSNCDCICKCGYYYTTKKIKNFVINDVRKT